MALSLLKAVNPSDEEYSKTDGDFLEALPVELFDRPLLCSLIYTALSLLFLGIYGKIGAAKTAANVYSDIESKHSGRGNPSQTLKKALSIWLPFYAYFMLDSDIVTVVMFLGLSIGLSPALRERVMPNLKVSAMSIIKLRKITVSFLAAMILFDVAGLTSSHGIFKSLKGFLCLGLAIFCIPDAYPSPWNTMPAVRAKLGTGEKPHPMNMDMGHVFQQDSTMNILTGAVLGVSVLFIHILMSGSLPSFPGLSLLFLAGFCAAASHLHSITTSSSGFQELGFICGAAVMVILIPASTSTLQSGIEAWSILARLFRFLLAYLSTMVDSRLSPSHSHGHSHNDHHVKPPSRATMWLLGVCENWPFIHAIIKERDSRRIFYFMWFVHSSLDWFIEMDG